MQEKWRQIKGFEGLYEVSNLGNVRSLGRSYRMRNGKTRMHKGRILKPGRDGGGYEFVVLRKDGLSLNRKIHRLVADAFVSGRSSTANVVNHIDENILNNRADNLEWCTEEYNLNYKHRRTREVATRGSKVAQYTKQGKLLAIYPSIGEASRRTGVKSTCIATITRYDSALNSWGHPRTSGGYIWKRGEDIDALWEISRWRKDFMMQEYDKTSGGFVDKHIFKK